MTSIEMRRDRAKLLEDAGQILKKAHGEGRQLTTEEAERFDKMHADADVALRNIERQELQERREAEVAATRLADRGDETSTEDEDDERSDEERKVVTIKRHRAEMRAFRDWLKNGWGGMDPRNREIAAGSKPNAAVMREAYEAMTPEQRAQTVMTTGGGYLIPRGFQREIDVAMLAYSNMRQTVRVLETATGNPLDWPTVNDTAVKGRLLGINTAVTTTDLTFGTKAFGAYKFSSDQILVPSELMQDADFGTSIDSFVRDALGERLGRITNDYFTTGTGSSQPQGIVTAATDSTFTLDISDFAAGTATANFAALLNIEHSIDPAYRPVASWMVHDSLLKNIKRMIDANGRPLFRAADAVPGGLDSIMGYPFTINQSMADSSTATNKALLFGAMKKFIIRAVRPMVMLRLNERYADTDQVGFIAFSREDSGLVNAGTNPIKYAAMAA